MQALGGAVIAPTALAVVLPDFPPQRRSMAIGLLGATGGLGAVAGPAIGSLLIDVWSWRGIFWINVPVCLAVLVLAPRLEKSTTISARSAGESVTSVSVTGLESSPPSVPICTKDCPLSK